MIFKDPGKFHDLTGNNQCICFTATPGGEDSSLEEAVLQHLKLKIIQDKENPEDLRTEKLSSDLMNFILETCTS